jgi:hypothetical protein
MDYTFDLKIKPKRERKNLNAICWRRINKIKINNLGKIKKKLVCKRIKKNIN